MKCFSNFFLTRAVFWIKKCVSFPTGLTYATRVRSNSQEKKEKKIQHNFFFVFFTWLTLLCIPIRLNHAGGWTTVWPALTVLYNVQTSIFFYPCHHFMIRICSVTTSLTTWIIVVDILPDYRKQWRASTAYEQHFTNIEIENNSTVYILF